MANSFVRNIARTSSLLLLGSIAVFSEPRPVEAAYSSVVSWADMSSLDLRPAFKSQYASPSNLLDPAISESAMEIVLRDADKRINPDFSIPAPLKPSVGFWLKIYAEYTTQHVVIFDSHHPEVVYEVLDFRHLAETARNRVVYEVVSNKKIKDTMAAYRNAFAHLSRVHHPKKPTREEALVLTAIAKLNHHHPYKYFAGNLHSQTGQRDNIIKGLIAAETFFPKMESIFTSMNVPTELTRLTLVESSFNLNAKSRSGAAGVWQFMPRSAKEYMTLDEKTQIDERLSPLKATVAAAKLLKRNKKILGHWALGVTAYNHGHGGLPRFNPKDGDFESFSHLFESCGKKSAKKRLGWAGRNYYAEFLAVLHAEAYRNLFYGDAPAPKSQTLAFRAAPAGKTAIQVAMEHGISLRDLQLYNPDILNIRRKLPRGFLIAIPGESDDLAGLTAKTKHI